MAAKEPRKLTAGKFGQKPPIGRVFGGPVRHCRVRKTVVRTSKGGTFAQALALPRKNR